MAGSRAGAGAGARMALWVNEAALVGCTDTVSLGERWDKIDGGIALFPGVHGSSRSAEDRPAMISVGWIRTSFAIRGVKTLRAFAASSLLHPPYGPTTPEDASTRYSRPLVPLDRESIIPAA